MKQIIKICLPALLALSVASCGYDNYDEPTSKLTGKVVYNGQQIGVRGTNSSVQLQLYQHGYDLSGYITVYVAQDGTFAATLFDGDYYMVTKDGNGPWVNSRDTTMFTLKGTADVTLEVTPYFTISGESITLSGNTVNASFTINQIVSTAKISQVMLLVSKTSFVDDVCYVARQNISAADAKTGLVSMSLDLSEDNQDEKALYARIGVSTEGADQAIYSNIVRLK